MGTPNYQVFDISSSDDEEENNCGKKPGDWLQGLLDDDDGNGKEDSDEVEIVGEVEGISSLSKSNYDAEVDDDDDDECMILDGDPEKIVQVANDTGGGGDEDELMVTGEKGQIACRDYPHPRHLCARYPFTTNPHEQYCDLCHCYVCDTKAPCIYWGTGVSNSDHCHSSDKEEIWKMQRKWIKQGKPTHLVTTNHPAVGPPVHKQVHSPSVPQTMNNGTIPQPYPLRPCSSQRNYHHSGGTAGRNSVAHPGVSTCSPLSSGANTRSNIQRDRASVRFVSPHGNFKKVNRPGPDYAHTYASVLVQSLNNNPKSVTYNGIQSTPSQDHLVGNNSELNACPRPQPYSQLIPPIQGYSQALPQPQAYSQALPQPQAYSQALPQSQAYHQPLSQPQIYRQPVLQPQAYNQPMRPQNQNHINTFPLNQASNMVNQNFPGLEPHLLNKTAPILQPHALVNTFSNAQSSSEPSSVTQPSSQQSEPLSSMMTQLSDVQSCSEPPTIVSSTSMQPSSGLTIKLSNVQPSSEPAAVADIGSDDFDLDRWIQSLEQQQDLIGGNGNLLSEPGFIPPSMLTFDFEN